MALRGGDGEIGALLPLVNQYGAVVEAVIVLAHALGGRMSDAHRVAHQLLLQRLFTAVDRRFRRVSFIAVRTKLDGLRRLVELPHAQFFRRDGEAINRPELEGFRRFRVVLEFGLTLQQRQDIEAAEVFGAYLVIAEAEGLDDFDAQVAV